MPTLTLFKQDPDPQKIIETLEDLLARAKQSEFESFVAVCMRPDGTFSTRSSGYKNGAELIGALTCVIHDLVSAMER